MMAPLPNKLFSFSTAPLIYGYNWWSNNTFIHLLNIIINQHMHDWFFRVLLSFLEFEDQDHVRLTY